MIFGTLWKAGTDDRSSKQIINLGGIKEILPIKECCKYYKK